MRYAVILNPAAGHGAAARKRSRIEAALRRARLDFQMAYTEGPGHATDLACRAARQGRAVVAVGGDGTVHEVSRGIIESGQPAPLGVIPVGTGNDFVKMIGVPLQLDAAARVLAEGARRQVDYGVVRWWDGAVSRSCPFVNAAGTGLDAAVASRVAGFKRLPGLLGYAAALLRIFPRWQAPPVEVSVRPPGGREEAVFNGPLLLATAGNGASSGGGFYLTPDASIADGQLDLCVVRALPFARVPRVLLRVLRGRHRGLPEITLLRATEIRLVSAVPLPVHADGEVLTHGARQVQVGVVPGGLCVIAPAAGR